MGAQELRDAFNLISEPVATCQKALMDYDRSTGKEMAILTFHGNMADGTAFSISSGSLPSETDVIVAARETALLLLKEKAVSP